MFSHPTVWQGSKQPPAHFSASPVGRLCIISIAPQTLNSFIVNRLFCIYCPSGGHSRAPHPPPQCPTHTRIVGVANSSRSPIAGQVRGLTCYGYWTPLDNATGGTPRDVPDRTPMEAIEPRHPHNKGSRGTFGPVRYSPVGIHRRACGQRLGSFNPTRKPECAHPMGLGRPQPPGP